MARLKVKQVEGAVDTSTAQRIQGRKTFESATAFFDSSRAVVITGGYIYWCVDPAVLNAAGNTRLQLRTTGLITEKYDKGNWVPI
jgi:hypothetical protein